MHVFPFDVLTSIGAGLGCLAAVLALRASLEPPRAIVRFTWLLLVAGTALVLRGLEYATGSTLAWHAVLVIVSALPLCSTLYVEALLHRHAHVPAKVLLLLGTLLGVVTSMTSWIADKPWIAVMLAYQIAGIVYPMVLAGASSLRPGRKLERSLAWAHVVGGAVCVPLFVTDWLPAFGVDTPRLGSIGILFLLYLVAAAHASGGGFAVRRLWLRLGVAAVGCAVLAVSVMVSSTQSFTSRASLHVGAATFLVLMFAFLVYEPVRAVLQQWRARPRELLLERLTTLPVSSLHAHVDALSSWPEVVRAVVWSPAWLQERGFDRVQAILRANPEPVTRNEIARAVRLSDDDALAFSAEQLDTLLTSEGIDHAVALPLTGHIVGLRCVDTLDASAVRSLLRHVARTAALLAAREAA